MKLKFFILPVVFLLNAGCASMFGPAFNPVTGNMNFYSGHVHEGVYSNTIGNTADAPMFSIAIPQASDSDEYALLQLTDQKNPTTTVVSFGPAPLDYTVYAASVSQMSSAYQNMTLDQLKSSIVSQNEQLIENTNSQSNLKKIYQADITFKNQPARYVVYTLNNQLRGGDFDPSKQATYAALLIIYPKYFALLSMDSQGQYDNAITDENRSQVINMTWPALVNYYDSFSINS